jgi:hypothetical protein
VFAVDRKWRRTEDAWRVDAVPISDGDAHAPHAG